jgi:hypothetical protein
MNERGWDPGNIGLIGNPDGEHRHQEDRRSSNGPGQKVDREVEAGDRQNCNDPHAQCRGGHCCDVSNQPGAVVDRSERGRLRKQTYTTGRRHGALKQAKRVITGCPRRDGILRHPSILGLMRRPSRLT